MYHEYWKNITTDCYGYVEGVYCERLFSISPMDELVEHVPLDPCVENPLIRG